MTLTIDEQNIEFIVKDGVRIAFFNEKGELFMIHSPTKADRRLVFSDTANESGL